MSSLPILNTNFDSPLHQLGGELIEALHHRELNSKNPILDQQIKEKVQDFFDALAQLDFKGNSTEVLTFKAVALALQKADFPLTPKCNQIYHQTLNQHHNVYASQEQIEQHTNELKQRFLQKNLIDQDPSHRLPNLTKMEHSSISQEAQQFLERIAKGEPFSNTEILKNAEKLRNDPHLLGNQDLLTTLHKLCDHALKACQKENNKENMNKVFSMLARIPHPYNWKIQQKEPSLEQIDKATPEQLLEMKANGYKITPQQFLEAAAKLKKNPLLEKDGKLGTTLHKLYDQAASILIEQDKLDEAYKVRSLAAQDFQVLPNHSLYNLSQAIASGTQKQTNPNFGAHFSNLDSGVVKGGNLRIDALNIEGVKQDLVQFRINEFARVELENSLDRIKDNPQQFNSFLPPGLKEHSIEIRTIPYNFLGVDDKTGECSNRQGLTLKGAFATEIEFKGLGKVRIGDGIGTSVHHEIQVQINSHLPPGEGAKKVQQMLTMLGLGPVLGEQREDDDKRMLMAKLFREAYPAQANLMERTKTFYELSTEDLKQAIINEVPDMKDIFEDFLGNDSLAYKEHSFVGRTRWVIPGIAESMKDKGAIGLMMGFATATDINSVAHTLVDILKGGCLSTMDRFRSRMLHKKGASSTLDIQSGGAGNVFTRLVTEQNLDVRRTSFANADIAQLVISLNALKRGGHAYAEDSFGVKGPHHSLYTQRSALMDFPDCISNESQNDFISNEVMVDKIDPKYIQGITIRKKEDKDEIVRVLKEHQLIDDKGNIILQSTANGFIEILKIPIDKFIILEENNKFKPEMWD